MKLMDDFFEQTHNMPMLPKVVQEVMQLLNSNNVNIKLLVEKINHDQMLSAKVLKMSNTAYFGRSKNVSTIQEAVSLIGLEKLNTLVIASGVMSSFTQVPGLDLKRFWQHSLVTASIARQLATELSMDAETAYITGLMHTVGQLLIHMAFPKAGAEIEAICERRNVLERHEVERSILGVDHNIVGEMLAKHWNFPENISRVIRYYTDPLSKEACDFAPVVYIASHIAFDLESNQQSQSIAETLSMGVAEKLGLEDTDALAERIDSYRVFVSEAKVYLQ